MVYFLRVVLTILILLTVLFQVLSTDPASNHPIITPSNDYAIDGKDYNLTCNTSKSTTFVIWQRRRSFIRQSTLNCSGEDFSFADQQRAHLYKYFCANNKTFTLSIPGSIILEEHETIWTCTGEAASAQFRLYVYYASHEEPHISGYSNLQDIREGENINLTCTVSGGYPLIFLSWTCNNILMNSSNQSTKSVAKIVLPLSIHRTLQGVQCICDGTSLANYSGSSNVTFKVNYPPTVTSIAIEVKFSNGTNYSLFCKVEDGNPSTYAISWSHTFSKRVVRTNQDLSNLQSNSGHQLTLTGASFQSIGEYTCSVHNNVTDLNGNLLQNKSVSIQRNFSAVFLPTNDNVFNAVYGKTFNVKIPFYCQPAINNIGDLLWFKDEKLLNQTNDLTFGYETTSVELQFYQTSIRVDGQVAIMNIKNVCNKSQGNFVLKVRNMVDVYETFEFKVEVKEEMKDPATTVTSSTDQEQQSSLPLIIGCVVAAIVIVAVLVAVVLYFVRKRKFNKDIDEKQRLRQNKAGNRELYRESNPYAEITETNANIQTAGPNSNPYSEPYSVQLAHNYYINTTNELLTASVSPYAETRIVQKPCTDQIRNGFDQNENTENKPVPVYAEVNKPKKNVYTNTEVGNAIYSNDSHNDKSNKVMKPDPVYSGVKKSDPVYSEVKKPQPSQKKDEVLESKNQTKQVDEIGAAIDCNNAQKHNIKTPDPVYSEVKKPKPCKNKDKALDSKDNTEQVVEAAAAKDSNDTQKDKINKSDQMYSEVKKPIPSKNHDDALDIKGQDLIVAEKSKLNDGVEQCEDDDLNYLELELNQQSDKKNEIISKREKVEYAEVKTVAY